MSPTFIAGEAYGREQACHDHAVHVALARAAVVPEEFEDDARLAAALEARGLDATIAVWNDPAVEWSTFDRVIVRSTWDYTHQLERFLAWADAIGPALRNPPELIRWNSDKRYVADIADAGLPVVETRFVEPGDPVPSFEGEIVVKPAVSAGARDTGRFGPGAHGEARALLARLGAAGRTAMVQRYLPGVEARGETAIVLFGGEPSHVLRKRAVLAPDEEAPRRDDDLGAAEAMYDDGLVTAGDASAAEHELAGRVVAYLGDRFGATPLYVRVDMVPGPDGEPVVLEVEAVEPNFYLHTDPAAADRLAALIADELAARTG
jgi:glutathione synthase/RimK-type ligase-like ATP-grasp enzyme